MRRVNLEELFGACVTVFGEEVRPSPGFLSYLQPEGIGSAFRKRAMELHPDRAVLLGKSVEECQREFATLHDACELLRRYIAGRDKPGTSAKPSSAVAKATPARETARRLPEQELRFGRFLYHRGIIQLHQIVQALVWQKKGRPRIGELGVQYGYLRQEEVRSVLRHMIGKRPFGQAAVELGLLDRRAVRELLRRQLLLQKKIGRYFVETGVVNDLELYRLLAECRRHNIACKRITG